MHRRRLAIRVSLVEDHRLVIVHEHAILEVPAHGAGEDDALELAAEADEVGARVAVGHAQHVLLDDGARIQISRGVVRRRPDDLDSPLLRLPVRIGAREGG